MSFIKYYKEILYLTFKKHYFKTYFIYLYLSGKLYISVWAVLIKVYLN